MGTCYCSTLFLFEIVLWLGTVLGRNFCALPVFLCILFFLCVCFLFFCFLDKQYKIIYPLLSKRSCTHFFLTCSLGIKSIFIFKFVEKFQTLQSFGFVKYSLISLVTLPKFMMMGIHLFQLADDCQCPPPSPPRPPAGVFPSLIFMILWLQEVLLWIKSVVDECGENITTEQLKEYVWKTLKGGKVTDSFNTVAS